MSKNPDILSLSSLEEIDAYIKRSSLSRKSSATILPPPVKSEEYRFYNLPTGPASNLIMEALGAGEDLADLPARKRKISHTTRYEVTELGQSRRLTMKTNRSEITVELSDIDMLTGSNKPAKKLFVFALIKANERAIFGGELSRDGISFPLQELVDIGFYKTPQSARKGFKDGMDILTGLRVKGFVQEAGNAEKTVEALEVLFTGAKIKKGQCTIYLNERINWSFITRYFTILPKYYFSLPSRASDLLYYIFYLARQHTREINARGYFTIGFRSIQSKLRLPSEINNGNPNRTIRQPIEDAIEEIENNHAKQYSDTNFQLFPVYDENAGIREFLDNGYLRVTLKGDFAEGFIRISRDTRLQIEKAEIHKIPSPQTGAEDSSGLEE